MFQVVDFESEADHIAFVFPTFVAANDDYLLDNLVDMGYISHDDIEQHRAEAEPLGMGIIDLMIERKLINSSVVTQAKAAHFGCEMVNLSEIRLDDDLISSVPRTIAKRYSVVPVYRHGNHLAIALTDPSDLNTIDSLHHLLHADLELKVATEEDIEAALKKYYGADDSEVSKMIQDITEGEVEIGGLTKGEQDESVVDADAPIIKLVNGLIVEAFKMRASDIHLEPMAKSFRVRYRIDGVLHEVKSPPKRLQAPIISRLKIQSNMSIAEKRIPQDGRIQTQVGAKTIDLRVSVIPTVHGESVVMRILDKEGLRLGSVSYTHLTLP